MNSPVRIYKTNAVFNEMILINLSDKSVTKEEKLDQQVRLYHNDELVGINIEDKDFANNFATGFNYPSPENLSLINDYLADLTFTYDANENLRIGQVLEFEAVANSNNLNLCQVKVGESVFAIVCGAANVEVGMKTVVALDNAVLPTGVLIKAGKVLNTDSAGMLCSKRELGFLQKSDEKGIIKLYDEESLDQSFFEVDWRSYNV